MTGRRLVFVPDPGHAPVADLGLDVIVLDTTWTPGPMDRSGLIPLRSVVGPILERIDLYRDALDRLEAWESETAIADRMTIDGVSWWFRQRPFIWYALHEHRLWLAMLDALDARNAAEIDIRADEPVLAEVASALVARTGASLHVPPPPSRPTSPSPAAPVRNRSTLDRLVSRMRPRSAPMSQPKDSADHGERIGLLDERAERLARDSGRSVLALSHPRVFQVIATDRGAQLLEPQLAPVMERLTDHGVPLVHVALELDFRRDDHWASIEGDDRLLPDSYVRRRWATDDSGTSLSAPVVERVQEARGIRLEVDDVDLAPAMIGRLEKIAGSWLTGQARLARVARRMFADLGPAAMFLNHEGIRTAWMSAARAAGVPIHAVQHGIIYPTHPVYRHERHPGIVYPDRTYVYGPYERSVLLDWGAYRPEEVEVSGSPRLDVVDPSRESRRAEIRRSLGVAEGHRMLVMSTANSVLAARFHIAEAMARILGGPLPGVHLVVKLHPGESDDGPYRALIEGLARAGGYPAPPISIVHDIDLFRLLQAADAHLGFHSTVLTDAVAAGTPNLMAAGHATADLLGYVEAGVARPIRNVDELRDALADPPRPDPTARQTFLDRHFRPGDASGRIAAGIMSGSGTDRRPRPVVSLRPAAIEDEGLLLHWANDPVTRTAGFHPEPIPVADHARWLSDRLRSTSGRLLIGTLDGRPVGQVRLDAEPDGRVEIGISVAPDERGHGIGRALLAAALAAGRADEGLAARSFVAFIRPDNAASIALFTGAGFRLTTTTEVHGQPCHVYERPV